MAAELLLGIADRGSMNGAAPEPRTAVMILVEVAWQENTGAVQSLPARMENRSTHGACIRIKTRVGVGSRLYVQSHREQFSGIVKYCRNDGQDFLVGIERDSVNRSMPKQEAAAAAPAREVARSKKAAVGRKLPGVPQRQEHVGREIREAQWNAAKSTERDGVSLASSQSTRIEAPIAARLMVEDVQSRESPRSEPPRVSPQQSPMPAPPVVASPVTQVPVEKVSEGRKAKKGRGFMKLKWFAGEEEEMLGPNGNSHAVNEPVQRAAEAAPRAERVAGNRAAAAESASGFQTELLAIEDIFRAAGITSPRRGYSITKVVEMLRSEHMRGLSKEMRRAAVLMALDAAGVSVEEVLQDAKVRHEAIDAYAAEQRKHAEAQWARKAEENLQIQAELELVKAHYAERIRRNLDGVAREKSTFGSWLKLKEQETQGMTEAVEQVLKAQAPSEPPADPLLSVTPASVTGKPV